MNTIYRSTVAAIAIIGAVSGASAQTNQRQYAAPIPIVGGQATLTNPANTILGNVAKAAADLAVTNGIGTRYTATSTSSNNTDTASGTSNVDTVFTLSGTVSKDCSFYAGNTAGAQSINFGTIGVKTGNNENVGAAFEMAGAATAKVESLTAGCNANNEVVLTKSSALGLVNSAPGGYDSDQFQANIPYSVKASWKGVALNETTTGTPQTLEVVANNGTLNSKTQGAWRSAMTIDFNAPAIADKGLVAGTYSGTTTLTLRAL
jgi:hypothetical protein